jgi:hypothetical protein
MKSSTRMRQQLAPVRLARVAVTAGIGLAAAVVVTVATPAHAAVVDVAVAGNGAVSATAYCPANQFLSGGGGGIIGGAGDVTLTGIVPDLAAGSVTVTGHDNPGGSPAYTVVAQAICLPGPPPANYQLVQNASGAAAESSKNVVATCPDGTSLLGTGFKVSGAAGRAFLRWSVPDFNLTSNTVIANAAGGFAGAWQAISYAICATPPGATTRLGQTTGANPANSKSSTTNACPGNTRTTGVGGAASTGPDIGGFVFVRQISTNLVQKEATAEGIEALDPGVGIAWDLDVFNICWGP